MNLAENFSLRNKIPVLDGFRGLAIILVLLYHYISSFNFGWIGVDLFFVLSGFLITGKLYESVGRRSYFANFYISRVLRIFPLYFLSLFIFFVLLPTFTPNYITKSYTILQQHQYLYYTFTINIYAAVNGWFSNVTLAHFWSLACEVQFYLLWPFIILLCYDKKYAFILLLITGFLFALGFRVFGGDLISFNQLFRYTLLPSRIDAFCAGALLYFLAKKSIIIKWWHIFIMLALLLTVVLVYFLLENSNWYFYVNWVSKYGLTVNAFFWLLILYVSIMKKSVCSVFFSLQPLQWMGKYSYAMYVVHLPLYFFIKKYSVTIWSSHTLTVVTSVFATILCSYASYHLFEKYFLRLKLRYGKN